MIINPDGILVLPFFNEGKRFNLDYLLSIIESIDKHNWTILAVNDGSTDDTLYVLSELNRKSNCVVLNLKQNVGKSNAVREGLCFATENWPSLKQVGFVDSDGAFDVRDIDILIGKMRSINADILIGSRIKMAGADINRSPLRHIIGRIISTVLNYLVLNRPIYDPQSGLKLFKVSENLTSALSLPFKTKWFGDVELLHRLRSASEFSVREFPVATWKDVGGGNLRMRNAFTVIKELLVLSRNCRFKNVKG